MAGYDPKQPRDDEGKWTDSGSSGTAAENEAADARSAKREKLQITELERKRKATEDKISKLRQDLENAKSSGADDFTVEQIETELNQEMRRLRAIEESALEITVTAAREAAGLAGDGRREQQRSNLESQILKVKTRIAELKESKKSFQGDRHTVKTRRDLSDEIYSYEKTLADLRQKLKDL